MRFCDRHLHFIMDRYIIVALSNITCIFKYDSHISNVKSILNSIRAKLNALLSSDSRVNYQHLCCLA